MTWLLVDGNNWFAQCEYASPGNGAINTCKRLETVLGQIGHSRAVVCWDGERSWRRDECVEYKSARQAKSDAFRSSLTKAQSGAAKLCESVRVDAYEADDLIATLTAWGKGEGEKVIIFSADKDLHQLLDAGQVTQVTKVTRVTATQCKFDAMTAENLATTYGVKPWQWVDFRVIVGDKSDSIKGCNGLGPAAALSVLKVCGSIDEYFEDQAKRWKCDLSPKQRTSLDNFRDQLPLKRKLMTLCDSVPLPATFFSKVAT